MGRIRIAGVCLLLAFAIGAVFSPASYARAAVNGEPSCVEFVNNELRVENSDNYCEPSITSGVTIETETGICTAGPLAFSEVAGVKKYYVLTAGHCIANGSNEGEEWESMGMVGGRKEGTVENPQCKVGPNAWEGELWYAYNTKAKKRELIGRGGSFVNTNTADYGEICIENPEWLTGFANNPVFAVTAEWNELAAPPLCTAPICTKRFRVKGLKVPAKNEAVCHEGQTTGESCGNIKIPLVAGTEFAKAEGKTLISAHGDSGGPWMFIEKASREVFMEGIHSHVTKANPKEKFFQLLQPALEGLTKLGKEIGEPPVQLLTTRQEPGECAAFKPGRYEDAKCQTLDEAKGKPKGTFEWETVGTCYKKKDGRYKEAKCETLDEKDGKPKGAFELAGEG